MKEKRDETIILRLSKTEKNRIYEKMLSMGIRSLSAYIRKMALDGYCLHLDLKELQCIYVCTACWYNVIDETKIVSSKTVIWLCRFPKHSNIEVLTGAESGKTAWFPFRNY